jgi:Outer membrane protein
MKKLFIVALVALMPFGAFAQKFGHFNSADILPLMPEYKAAEAELQELTTQYQDEFNYMVTEYQKKEDDYLKNRDSLPEATRQRREQDLADSQQKIQEYRMNSSANLENKQAELLNNINEKALKAVKEVGEEGGYICIFDLGGGVPFVNATLTTDVTEPIKAKLGIK